MERTVKELRALAKNAGLRGYSRMRKAELVTFLEENYILSRNILDAPVPNIGTSILQPTSYVPPAPLQQQQQQQQPQQDWSFLDVPQPAPRRSDRLKKLQKSIKELYKQKEKPFEINETESALNRFATQYKIDGRSGYEPKTFLAATKQPVVNLLVKNRQTKVVLVLRCMMEKTNLQTGEVVVREAPFWSGVEVNLEATNLDELYEKWKSKILENISTFQNSGSGWVFKSVVSLEIHTVKYEPMRGSSYIPLPEYLAKKQALINLKNDDQQCFKWAVTRAINPTESHPERIDKKLRAKADTLNWNGITFPTPLSEIDKFERNNPNVSVNVAGFAEKGSCRDAKYENIIYPLRTSPYKREHEVDLLLFSGDAETRHYCVIKNMSRLLHGQRTKKHATNYYCRNCYTPFTSKKRLATHDEICRNNDTVKIEMPKQTEDYFPTQYFKKHFKSQNVPFVVYADFESFTKPISSSQPDPKESYTKKYQKHEPSGFCYYIKCFDDSVYSQDPVIFTKESEQDDVAQIFVNTLEENIRDIYQKFRFQKKMIFGPEDQKVCEKSTHCHICKQPLTPDDKTNYTVRDHCHFTGKFRGAAHNSCNLSYRKPKFFPVIFHNLAGYDAHLFIKNLGKTEGEIDCIPSNEEKYISFTKKIIVDTFTNKEGEEIEVKRDLRFIDSFKFLSTGLDKLVANLTDYPEISKFFQDPQLQLLLRKGVYPYDHVNSLEKLQETSLPPKEAPSTLSSTRKTSWMKTINTRKMCGPPLR